MSEETREPLRRYDLVPNYRCGGVIDEMERRDDGDWVPYEQVEDLLARITALEQENEQLRREGTVSGINSITTWTVS